MKRNQKTIRPSRLAIDPKKFIKARGEKDGHLFGRVLRELKTFDFYQRHDLISQLASHPQLPQAFIPVYGKTKVFHGVTNVKNWISETNYALWIFTMFEREHELLKRFCQTKTIVGAQILKGEAVPALQALASLSEYSESWWSIEQAIHINKELLKNDTKGYIKRLQETYPHLSVKSMTHDYLLLSEGNTVNLYTENVLGRFKEYASSGIPSALRHAAAESCLLLPMYFDKERKPTLDALYDYSTHSIIDQYVLFRNIVTEMYISGRLTQGPFFDRIVKIAQINEDRELLNVFSLITTEQPFVATIVESYTLGKYSDVLSEIENAIDENSPNIFGLIEIYARSKLYVGKIGSRTTFFDLLADEFALILKLDAKSVERADHLYKITVKFRDHAWSKSLLYHLVSMQVWNHNKDAVELARLQTRCLGGLNTPKARHQDFRLSVVNDDKISEIPFERVIRYSKGPDVGSVVDKAIFPIYSDYLKTQSRLYIEQNKITEAIDFCIDEYLKNNVAFNYLPIGYLCETVEALEKINTPTFISCLILYDIYGRERDSAFDESKTELFEEFLRVSGTHEPSKIFKIAQVDKKTAYFLRHICVPAQLDNLTAFKNNDEVIHERVAIIDFLISAKIDNSDELRAEKDKVLETLFSEKLRAKIESGKLFVDVQALEAHRKHIYASMYEQAKSLEGGLSLDPISLDEQNIDSSDIVEINNSSRVAITSSEKSGILVKIFYQATLDFALNENYGLDKYLSAEVRHVVFETQLRSVFEKFELVTVQKQGAYLSNEYWVQKYNYVSPEIVQSVDELLGLFSSRVDFILEKVNDRFRVNIGNLESDNIFDFNSYHDRIVCVSNIIDQAESFEDFFANLISYMWELAGESARAAQQLINDILLTEILEAIDALENEISLLKGNVAMADLMQVIKNARSDFKKEIELVLNWFRFVGSEDVDTFERLGVVVEATVSSFKSMFRHQEKELIFTQEKSGLQLTYSEARSLFISLFTALENAWRYSPADASVHITHQVVTDGDQITISNSVEMDFGDAGRFVSGEKAKWTDEFSSLSTAEGGTGLYKIHNLLTNASPGFDFDISVADYRFNAFIGLNHEYFDNRRQSAKAREDL